MKPSFVVSLPHHLFLFNAFILHCFSPSVHLILWTGLIHFLSAEGSLMLLCFHAAWKY